MINLDKLIELSLRSIICILNNDEIKADDYKNKALKLYEKRQDRYKYNLKVEDHVSKAVKNKLYELVS